jgi:hypothetical protein
MRIRPVLCLGLGTILKMNPTKALVAVDEGGQQRKYHVPYNMLQALPQGMPRATVNAPKAKPKPAPKAKSKAKLAVPKMQLKRRWVDVQSDHDEEPRPQIKSSRLTP